MSCVAQLLRAKKAELTGSAAPTVASQHKVVGKPAAKAVVAPVPAIAPVVRKSPTDWRAAHSPSRLWADLTVERFLA